MGKFVKKAQPFITLAGLALGGVGGIVGQTISFASKTVDVLKDPMSLIPGYGQIKERLINTPIAKKILNNPISNSIKSKYNDLKSFTNSTVEKTKNFLLNNKVTKNVVSAANHASEVYQKGKNYILNHPATIFIKDKVDKSK